VSSKEENYERGAEITYRLIRDWPGEVPRFAFPPKEIALLADLRDVGERLARNEGARRLLALLIKRCVERTGNAPTAMMLRVVLEELGIDVEYVSLGELGIGAGSA
jgi:hypothetical protein